MKKNAMLKIAAILLVAVLLTTCAISTTFAKYVTNGVTYSDNARVAAWGLSITNTTADLFASDYGPAGSLVVNGSVDTGSYNNDIVVAPGTKNTNAIDVDIVGTPEVAYVLKATATVELLGWTLDGSAEYCPLEITVNGTTYKIVAGTEGITTVAKLQAAVEEAILDALLGGVDLEDDYTSGATVEKNFAANTEAPTGLTVAWAWPQVDANNEKDTALGDRAAADNAATIAISYSLSAEQVLVDGGATPAA